METVIKVVNDRVIGLEQKNRILIFRKKKECSFLDCVEVRLINGKEEKKWIPINLDWFQIVRRTAESHGQLDSMAMRGPFGDFFKMNSEHFELIYQLSLKD